MLLKDYLNTFKKTELTDIAHDLHFRGFSQYNKADLIQFMILMHYFEDNIKDIFALMSERELALYQEFLNGKERVSVDEIYFCEKFHDQFLGYYDEDKETFCVFEEIKKGLSFLEKESFKEEHYKKSWLNQCINYLKYNYAVAPVEIFYQLYHLKIDDSLNDMLKLIKDTYRHLHIHLQLTCEGNNAYPQDHPLQTDVGHIFHQNYVPSNFYLYILKDQGNHPYYMPTQKEIEHLYLKGYDQHPRYDALEKKCCELFKIKPGALQYIFSDLYEEVNSLASLYTPETFIFSLINDMDLSISSHQRTILIPYIVDAINNTRSIKKRGHYYMEYKNTYASRPTNTNKMKKVGPNDPCPCGSGKKYKKCCRP